MTHLAEIITSDITLYCVLSAVNHMLVSLICILAVPAIFRVTLRKHPLLWVVAGLLSVAVGVSRPFFTTANEILSILWEVLAFLLPFVSVALMVPVHDLLKGMAAALGYSLTEIPKYLILILFFRFDKNEPDAPASFLVELLLHILLLLTVLPLYARRERKRNMFEPLLLLDPVFYVLIVMTTGVFMTSIVLFGSSLSYSEIPAFIFVLMNVPLFVATLTYGAAVTIRSKMADEAHKRELEMQILHYEKMEQLNEDLRIFRHDLRKKLRPMVAYMNENNTEAAKEIAEELGAFVQTQGQRYRTGNYRLDTVLFCEQQGAKADGIDIVFTDESCFPAEGIDPDDIYIIFPNAIANAVEACRQVKGERKITVTSKIVGDDVFVTVSNPCSGKLTIKDGVPQTTKRDRNLHGYGLRSIKKAAANYGSDNVDFVVENGRFTLRVSLRFKNSLSESQQIADS